MVRTERQARRYTEMLQPEQPYRPGDLIATDPCVGEKDLARHQEVFGRECPRIDLHPDNALAANLAVVAMSESLHPFMDIVASEEDDPDSRRRAARRAMRGLGDDEVQRLRAESMRRHASDPDRMARGTSPHAMPPPTRKGLRPPIPFNRRPRGRLRRT